MLLIPPAITVDIDREPAVNGGLTPQQDHVLDDGLAHLSHHVVERDDASAAFLRQIDALRRSEEIQRHRSAQEAEIAAFIKANPDMIKHPEITGHAELLAQRQGHEYGSPEFYTAVKSIFEDHIHTDHQPAKPLQEEPTPKSFEPLPPSIPSRGSIVSAPVSRETFANGGYNSYGERPGRVTLSPAQKEAARFAGISETEYAKGVLELRERKERGDFDR